LQAHTENLPIDGLEKLSPFNGCSTWFGPCSNQMISVFLSDSRLARGAGRDGGALPLPSAIALPELTSDVFSWGLMIV
jgi:hypothetical protein